MRTIRPKTSPAAVPTSAFGTGSLTGRTRQSSLVSTAVTAAALAATQKPSVSSRWNGRLATSSA